MKGEIHQHGFPSGYFLYSASKMKFQLSKLSKRSRHQRINVIGFYLASHSKSDLKLITIRHVIEGESRAILSSLFSSVPPSFLLETLCSDSVIHEDDWIRSGISTAGLIRKTSEQPVTQKPAW